MYFSSYPNWQSYNPNYLVQITPGVPFPSMPPPQIPGLPRGTYPVPPLVPGGFQVPGRMPSVPEDISSMPMPSSTQRSGPPTSPPPQYKPQKSQAATGTGYAFMVDPVVVQYCLNNYTYVWLKDGSEFWYYPFTLGQNSIGGYLWDGTRWIYYGLDLNKIDTVSCP